MYQSHKGFTLVEAVVAVALTAVLTGLTLQTVISVNRVYSETVKANLLQSQAVHAMDFIKLNIRSAPEAQIQAGSFDLPQGHAAIWCENNRMYYDYGDGGAVYMPDLEFSLQFVFDGGKLNVRLGVLTEGEPYVLESAVTIENAGKLDSGSAILLKRS